MNRLDRRLRILRGKRNGAYSTDQVYFEAATRGRAARRVRMAILRLRPVLLITPRWSQVPRFLDDIALDLQIHSPPLESRVLSLSPLQGRPPHETWGWLVKGLTEFCEVEIAGRVAQAVNRQGFRAVLAQLFARTTTNSPRALLMHGFEHLHVETRDDLLTVYRDHLETVGTNRRVVLLFAGAIDGPNFELEDAERIVLPDFGPEEAMEALAEYTGPTDRDRMSRLLDVIGGVPALIDRLGSDAEANGKVAIDRDLIWRALGSLAEEVRGAVAIVSSVDGLAERLDDIAKAGSLPEDAKTDRMLVRAGLLAVSGPPRKVSLRAPMFAEIAGQAR